MASEATMWFVWWRIDGKYGAIAALKIHDISRCRCSLWTNIFNVFGDFPAFLFMRTTTMMRLFVSKHYFKVESKVNSMKMRALN